MLIKFFRSSYLIQYFALALITAALWIPGFRENQGLPVSPVIIAPIYGMLHYVLSLHPVASPAFAIAIILVTAFALNNILIFHELTPKNNLLPAFLFIVLMSSNPHTLCSYPVLTALLFFVWFLHTIYRMNDSPDNYMEVFNASMLASVISMIYPVASLLFFFIWITLLVYGTFNGRNLLISFIAFSLPYLYLFLYFFWTDGIDEALAAYVALFREIMVFSMNREILQIILWALFTLFMLIPSFFRITGNLSSFGINFRKKMAATAWLLAFSIPMIVMQGKVDYHTLLFLPATILIAHYFHQFKKSVLNETVLLVFILLALIGNYWPLLHA
ncbi:MAG TPA: hypothetical protein PLW31_13975 [Bacteroidales bacterium]|nr:hypothetical protein [Bacteroidales bacterium]HPI86309.1 hypothetical protein [Bacteroidales bacterium]HPM92304.1 hypothetical protein [Bacteroidales bacterium]